MSPFPDANSSFCHPKFIFSRVPSNRKSTTQVPKPLPASKTSAQAICFSPSPHQHGNKPQLSTFTLMSILQQQPEGAFKNENHQRPFLSNASSIPGYSWDKIQKLQQDLQNLEWLILRASSHILPRQSCIPTHRLCLNAWYASCFPAPSQGLFPVSGRFSSSLPLSPSQLS